MTMKIQGFFSILIWGLGAALSTQALEQPLYELGIGLGGLKSPHYLGADQHHNLVAPVPFLIYRGDRLRFDRSGLKAYLVDERRWDFNISVAAALPVDSDDNRARRGMDDLDPMLEIGPTLRYTLWHNPDNFNMLRLDLPLRATITSDFNLNVNYRGLTSSPGLIYYSRYRDWNWSASTAAIFGDRDYHGYFYDVDERFVTPRRQQYRADAGYTGARVSLATTRYFDNWFVGAYVRYYSMHGAANEDSPLMRQRNNFSAGLMFAWLFKQSSTMVDRPPDHDM